MGTGGTCPAFPGCFGGVVATMVFGGGGGGGGGFCGGGAEHSGC